MNPQNRQSPSFDSLNVPFVALCCAFFFFVVPCQFSDGGKLVLETKFGRLIILLVFRFMDMLVTELLRPYFPENSKERGLTMVAIGLFMTFLGWSMLR